MRGGRQSPPGWVGTTFSFYQLHLFWLCWVFVAAQGFAPVLGSGGYSVAVQALLMPVASLIAEHGPWGAWALSRLPCPVHGLSCSVPRAVFPDQGSNPSLLHRQVVSLPLSHQGSPPFRGLLLGSSGPALRQTLRLGAPETKGSALGDCRVVVFFPSLGPRCAETPWGSLGAVRKGLQPCRAAEERGWRAGGC